MKIIQILTNLNVGDAIGNDVLAIDDTLREYGYSSGIMASTIHEKLNNRAVLIDFSKISPDDIVLFHKATGDELTRRIAGLSCRKGMIYHNITPAKFFIYYDPVMAWNQNRGRNQLKKYASYMDFCWGDSEYNCQELRKAGAKNVSVLPVFHGTTKRISPDPGVMEKLKKISATKILFIGRIAPNKKYEDLIKSYYWYLNKYDNNAKLFLIGGWTGMEKYYAKLKGFCADLELSDDQVIFTGHVNEEEKEAYLRNTNVMLCLSEHEGFCVPLIEAMERDLPVIAFVAAAVPETLGDNGLLLNEKKYDEIAALISKICNNDKLRKMVLLKQKEHLKKFEQEKIKSHLLTLIKNITDELP